MLPGLIIAADSSGAGKTSAALALIAALRGRGLKVAVAKLGPDYLDAAWLAWAGGVPCANLDSRMTDRRGLLRLRERLENLDADALICESAMGLYDGDRLGRGSAAELAAILDLPILLLLNAKGKGQSIAALAEGFLNYKGQTGSPRFLGLVCSRVSGSSHKYLLRAALEPALKKRGVAFLGALLADGAPPLASRHLGLIQAAEKGARVDVAALGRWAERDLDLDKLIRLAGFPARGKGGSEPGDPLFFPPLKKSRRNGPVVAAARDEAFDFCYADLPALLTELGCSLRYFSPLADEPLPDCDGCYLPGGYPELYAERLSANHAALLSLRRAAALGTPIYAECGGFVYLSRSLRDLKGKVWPMAGLIPQDCRMTERLQALGYRRARGAGDLGEIKVRGHEFHYCRGEGLDGESPLWLVDDEIPQGYKRDSLMASWIHLYPEGSRAFWKRWVSLCREFRERERNIKWGKENERDAN